MKFRAYLISLLALAAVWLAVTGVSAQVSTVARATPSDVWRSANDSRSGAPAMAAGVSATTTYTITEIGTLGGSFSSATGINESGQVVGNVLLGPNTTHAILWQSGVITDLGTLGGMTSFAFAINNAGQVVGRSDTASRPNHAFLWQNGSMTDLDPTDASSVASALNDSGQVVGTAAVLVSGNLRNHAFLWQNGTSTDLGTLPAADYESSAHGINQNGQVVGMSAELASVSCNGSQVQIEFGHGVLWPGGAPQELGSAALPFCGGGVGSAANAINSGGQVVGYAILASQTTDAYLWQTGTASDIGTLPGWSRTTLNAINKYGRAVGYAQNGSQLHAALWRDGTWQDLNDLIPPGSGWVLNIAYGINDAGQIVGQGTHNGQQRGFVLTPRAWTLMFYLDGDNSLDQWYPAIMQQLQNAATNPDVQIVALWDSLGGGGSAYYVFNTSGAVKTQQGELVMSDFHTLVNFVNWAQTNYPAQHYALLLDDHGSGVTGGLRDDTPSTTTMSVPQIGAALSTISAGGANKLDVLVMNMCLMGMLEDAFEVQNYVNYYVASENEQWSYSIGYFTYASSVTRSTTPAQFATAVVNGYANDPSVSTSSYTMSAADMAQLSTLVNATNSLAQQLTAQITTTAPILTNVRQAVQRYDNLAEKPPVIDLNDQNVDLYDFARLVKVGVSDAGIQSAAQAVMDAVTGYIIAERHNSVAGHYNLSGSHGVSIFLPPMRSSFYTGVNLSFAIGTTWGGFSAQRASDATNAWGPMLVRYFQVAQPGGPDDPNLPPPVPKLVKYDVYLPLVVR